MVVQETIRYVLCAEESDLTPVIEAMARQGLWLDSVDRQVFQREGGRIPGSSHEPLAIPASGKYVRGFGEIESPVDGTRVFHSGIDILTETGAPVRATLDGKVTGVCSDPVLGRTVEIQHDDGLTTVYGNLGEILVEKNQRVRQGEIIGKAGEPTSGHGGNLHFEVRENGKPVDPLAKMATVRTSI
ncbi:MAG TPA: M23 family metallopeptidase [Clostridia bacterium]|nr:M23 family metallopeptidase [Clostridia bacterium]